MTWIFIFVGEKAQDSETEIQGLLISQPWKKNIGLVCIRNDNEVPAEMVSGKKPKRKRLIVHGELRMNHMVLVNEQRLRYQEFGSKNYSKTDAEDQKKKIEFTLLLRKKKCNCIFFFNRENVGLLVRVRYNFWKNNWDTLSCVISL